jgi:hypothetical protein
MKRYVVGGLFGAAFVFLLGAAGDMDPVIKRVAALEDAKNVLQSKISVLDTRLTALEKKLAAGATATPAATGTPAAGADVKPADPATPADSTDSDPAQKLKDTIRALRTANFEEIENCPNLWVSPLDSTAAGERTGHKVQASGKLHYIGADDLTDYDLKFQVNYYNQLHKLIGQSDLTVSGEVLKQGRYFTFRQTTPVSEEYVLGDTTKVVFVTKTKTSRSH